MLKIRFNRIGRRNRPYYRIVVQEHTAAPGGRHVAIVGSYDPHEKKTIFKEDAIAHWLSVGAQPSDTVHNLFIKHGIIRGKKRPKGKIVQPEVKEEEKSSKESVKDTTEKGNDDNVSDNDEKESDKKNESQTKPDAEKK